MFKDKVADIIKIAAILTAVTRWAGAIAEAEGFPIPVEWQGTWRIAVFALSACMGVAEGLGIWYVMRAWRSARVDSPQYKTLFALVIVTGIVFAVVQTPWLVAQTKRQEISTLLPDWGIWVWNAFVALSAFVIAGSVGYAQRVISSPAATYAAHMRTDAAHNGDTKSYMCKLCGDVSDSASKYASHMRWAHKNKAGTKV